MKWFGFDIEAGLLLQLYFGLWDKGFMQATIFKKSLVAFIFALILILTVHRAVAASVFNEESVTEIPAYEAQEFSAVVVDCQDLKASLLSLQNSLLGLNAGITDYTENVLLTYEKWHRKLQNREDRRHSYALGEFAPQRDAVEKLAAASDAIFTYEDQAARVVENWGAELMACPSSQEEWAGAVEISANRSREHFSATANFFAQMKDQLGDWVRVWSTLEGKTEVVPAGYFQSLADHAEVYAEAAQLFRDNAALSLAPLDVIVSSDIVP